MDIHQIRTKYLNFFKKRGHAIIPSASLVPEGDATTLFTSAGMQPMMPYLVGEKHPSGTRIVDSQKCFRSQDIEEVGDNRHTTFFEMLGNWSLGDYWKPQQLNWFFEFLTNPDEGLGLDPKKLYVSIYEGGSGVDKDSESLALWQEIFKNAGVEAKEGERIFSYPAGKNWWSRAGAPDNMPVGEPGGPDSEVFYDFGIELGLHEASSFKDQPCHPNCDCGRFLEVGNSVFMQYQKLEDGTLKELPQKNIDFGGGLTRLEAAVKNDPDIFHGSAFDSLIREAELITSASYMIEDQRVALRIIADHITAATFLIQDGVVPTNKAQGYVLRRLIRRAAVKMYGITHSRDRLGSLGKLAHIVVETYGTTYFGKNDAPVIAGTITTEIERFASSLEKGMRELEKVTDVTGKVAFDLYQSYGFPLEITLEVLRGLGKTIDTSEFEASFEEHKETSRIASAEMFKGGLADNSATVTAYHTVTHLLHSALREILGDTVSQKGSNITAERLRFDFSYSEKISDELLKNIEDTVNLHIDSKLPVVKEELPREEAEKTGALHFFNQKYPDIVSVYSIGEPDHIVSREFCGGPHVANTSEIGKIKVVKQETLGAGVRRLYLQFV